MITDMNYYKKVSEDSDETVKVMGHYLTVNNVFGGSNGSGASIDRTTKVDVIDGIISENVYGGGNKAPVVGSTNVTVEFDSYISS